ncbi:Cyclic nucleotide-binding protein [Hyphomicrobium sp. 1Nfss2.1]|uniref:Acb2/Tad1 domain-containing protein n=1 Tax=Hyphomicrobium sp. 1Nfss2.1 TaxID=3413936 RepID=UPI003C7E8821
MSTKEADAFSPDTKHAPLPVAGYTVQSGDRVAIVNINKQIEEEVLRRVDDLARHGAVDGRWLSIGKTHLEQAFMAINRAVFKPERVKLPGDDLPPPASSDAA